MRISFFVLFIITPIQLIAQVKFVQGTTFTGYDKNLDFEEFITFDLEKETIMYWSNKNMDKVALEIVEGSIYQRNLTVKFPSSDKKYRLRFSQDYYTITCVHFDGYSIKLTPSNACIPSMMKYTTTNPNTISEHIYIYYYVTPRDFYYASSINPQRIKLERVNLNETTNKYDYEVRFPGDSKIYYLDFVWDKQQLICINPNGSKQTFYKEW